MRFALIPTGMLACLALGGCITTGTGGADGLFAGAGAAQPAEPAPPDPAQILAAIDSEHLLLRAGGLKVPLVKPVAIGGVQPASLTLPVPVPSPAKSVPEPAPELAPTPAPGTQEPASAPAPTKTAGFFGRLLNSGSAAPSCPGDLSFYRAQLQLPSEAVVDPGMPVHAYLASHGGAETASAQLKTELASYESSLASEKAARNPFDAKSRATSDRKIAKLEDSILLSEALIEAIDCAK